MQKICKYSTAKRRAVCKIINSFFFEQLGAIYGLQKGMILRILNQIIKTKIRRLITIILNNNLEFEVFTFFSEKMLIFRSPRNLAFIV